MRHDQAWVDDHRQKKVDRLDWRVVLERWNNFRKVIYYEFEAMNRIRAQVLSLVATKGEIRRAKESNGSREKEFCDTIDWSRCRLYTGSEDDLVCLWPVAVRAPMSHKKRDDGVRIDEWRLSYRINPGIASILRGGFHRTKLDVFGRRIIQEGLKPGGDGDRGSTFFVLFAPWDRRSYRIVKYKSIPPPTVYIYLTADRLCEYDARLSADGHVLVQQVIPFSAFDGDWYEESDGVFKRLLVKNGESQMVLSVEKAKSVASIEKFSKIMKETIMQNENEPSEVLNRLNEIDVMHRAGIILFPGHPKWSEAVSLMALIYKSQKPCHRLCPACLTETHDMMAVCFTCHGKLISLGWRRKKTIPTGGEFSPDDDLDPNDVRDHVNEAWENVKEEEDLDEEEELPEEATELGKDDEGADKAEKTAEPEAPDARFRERKRDDVDDFLDQEKAESDQAVGATSGVRDAQEYPSWMKRIEFGSKVLPEEPCVVGDAQSELIHILILMIANNICTFISRHYNLFCEGIGKLASADAEKTTERLDVDPKIPYLGIDDDGELIEPTDEQLEEFYKDNARPGSKHDLGEDGYVRSYYGSLIFKRLATYILECGYMPDEFKARFLLGEEGKRRHMSKETAVQEEAAHELASAHLAEQSRFMRRFIAGAYDAMAVYFFRNQQFINTIYLNPVDLLCACRTDYRRIAVIHMCLQNGLIVPRVFQQRMYNAIQEWNSRKKRNEQRPQWATHSSQAHVLAIVDSPVPPEFKKDTRQVKEEETEDVTEEATSSSVPTVTTSTVRPPTPPAPSRALGAEPKHAPKGKEKGKSSKGKARQTEYTGDQRGQAPWRQHNRGWNDEGYQGDCSRGGHRDWRGGYGR
eukprot:s3902_g3.t1